MNVSCSSVAVSYVVGGPRIIDVVGGPPLPIGDISGHHDVTHAGL